MDIDYTIFQEIFGMTTLFSTINALSIILIFIGVLMISRDTKKWGVLFLQVTYIMARLGVQIEWYIFIIGILAFFFGAWLDTGETAIVSIMQFRSRKPEKDPIQQSWMRQYMTAPQKFWSSTGAMIKNKVPFKERLKTYKTEMGRYRQKRFANILKGRPFRFVKKPVLEQMDFGELKRDVTIKNLTKYQKELLKKSIKGGLYK